MKYDGTHGNGYQPIDVGGGISKPPTTGSKAIQPTESAQENISDVFNWFKTACIENDSDLGACIVDDQYELTIMMKKMKEE